MKVVTQNGDFDLGVTEATPTIGMTDFSRRVTDDFGVTTVVERGFSRRMSVKLAVPTANVDAVHRRLSDLRASSALWVADDQSVWLSLYGFYRSFDIDRAGPLISWCTLEVDALAETANVNDGGADPAPGRPSTYRLLKPLAVTDAILAGSTVAEGDAAEWAAGAAYAKGARVIRSSTHRVYESLIAGNVGKVPEGQPAWWLDVGPTNRWAMFDQALGTATTLPGGFTVTLNGGASDALALIDVIGDTVRVQAGGYDRSEPVRPGAIVFRGLPGGQVTVTVAGGQAAAGTLLIGRMLGIGVTEISPTAGITDFSRKETDDFGAVTVVERAYAKRMSAGALIRTEAIDVVADRLAGVRAQPALWIAEDGSDCLTVYGLMKEFSIERGVGVSKLSLSVDGLAKAAPAAPAATTLVPLGAYDPAKTYAAGALVDYQGATWRYINAVPSAGYAPPALPATRNDFWEVFSSVGMTPAQQEALAKAQQRIADITSDGLLTAGSEKSAIKQQYDQLVADANAAHVASEALLTTYGADATYDQRANMDAALVSLNTYLGGLLPRWDNITVDTAVDGAQVRMLFGNAWTKIATLLQAVDAYVSSRTKGAIDRVAAIGSDNVLSAGSEKQTAVIDWNTLYQDLESLYAKYVALGSPADLTTALNAASAARTALGSYLGNLAPPWNQISTDTPIVSADWSSNWTTALQRINDLRAQIGGRKGDPGADAEVYRLSATGLGQTLPALYITGLLTAAGDWFLDPDFGNSSRGEARSYTVCWRDNRASWRVRHFDVYGNGEVRYPGDGVGGIQGFRDCVFNIPDGAVVVVYSYDEPTANHRDQRMLDALYLLGAEERVVSPTVDWPARSAFTHVGVKGWARNRGFTLQSAGVIQTTFSVAGSIPSSDRVGRAGDAGLSAPLLRTQWSIDGVSNWHDNYFGADVYQRQSNDNGASWGPAYRVVGENGTVGQDGSFTSFVFRRSPTVPAAPADNSGNPPANWTDGPPDGTDFLWQSKATFRGANQLTSWTSPVRISGEDGFSVETTTTFNQQVFSTGANKPSWIGGSGVIKLLKGGTRITAGVTYDVINNSGVAGLSINGDTFTFSGAVDDVGAFTVRAIYNGQAYEKVVAVKKVYDGEAAFKGAFSLTGGNGSASMTVPAGRQCVISGSASYAITGNQVGSYQATMSLYWRNKTDNGPSNFLGSVEGSIASSKNVGTPTEPVYERQPGSVSAAFAFIAPSPSKEIEYIVVTNRTAGSANANVQGGAGMEVRS